MEEIRCLDSVEWEVAWWNNGMVEWMRFKRSNSNLENFHDVFGVAAFSLLLTPWRDIS